MLCFLGFCLVLFVWVCVLFSREFVTVFSLLMFLFCCC